MAIGRTNAGSVKKLTGSAQPSDVLIGKTFYNTDPKTKLTGTALRRASGTYTPPQDLMAKNTITGLGFTPVEVWLYQNTSVSDMLYLIAAYVNGSTVRRTGNNYLNDGITIIADGFEYTGVTDFYLRLAKSYSWFAFG
jgi:hypothetical protein